MVHRRVHGHVEHAVTDGQPTCVPATTPCHSSRVPEPLPGCHDSAMAATSAELSSLATALDELTRRVTVHAESADTTKDEETARELFAIERSLASANRRLSRLALSLQRR